MRRNHRESQKEYGKFSQFESSYWLVVFLWPILTLTQSQSKFRISFIQRADRAVWISTSQLSRPGAQIHAHDRTWKFLN